MRSAWRQVARLVVDEVEEKTGHGRRFEGVETRPQLPDERNKDQQPSKL
jgi:hypothetical protein